MNGNVYALIIPTGSSINVETPIMKGNPVFMIYWFTIEG